MLSLPRILPPLTKGSLMAVSFTQQIVCHDGEKNCKRYHKENKQTNQNLHSLKRQSKHQRQTEICEGCLNYQNSIVLLKTTMIKMLKDLIDKHVRTDKQCKMEILRRTKKKCKISKTLSQD